MLQAVEYMIHVTHRRGEGLVYATRRDCAPAHTLIGVTAIPDGPEPRWKRLLNGSEAADFERAVADDEELEHEIEAMLDGLAPARRLPFLRHLLTAFARTDSPHAALLLALGELRSTRREQS